MAAQNPRLKKSRWGLGCGITFGVVFLIVLFAGAYLLVRARLTNDILSSFINDPVMNQQVEAGQPVNIQAGATYPRGVSRVEVYADGALILAQDGTGQGQISLSLTDTWIPPTSGRHALLARGYASADLYADSAVVYVDVAETPVTITIDVDNLPREPGAPNPSLNVIAQYLGTTPEELIRRNPSLGGSDPAAPIPPGTRVEGPHPPASPPSPPVSPPRSPGNPAAPTGLSGTADCTNANLSWTASPDAQSYRIYRLGPSDTRPTLRAEGVRTIPYPDALPAPGVYRYQVASVRGGREGLSLMVTISTPASCAGSGAPPGTSTDLLLTVAMVDTNEAWDGVYCYLSVIGRAYEHIPAGDSSVLSPEAANRRYYNLTRLPGGGGYNLTGHPLTSPVTLRGECYGRRGPVSTGLGTFSVSHPQAQWDGTLRSASGGTYRFSYCLGPSTRPCTPTIPGVSTPRIGDLGIFLGDLFYLPAPTSLRRTTSTEACGDLPDLFDRITCSSSGLFCLFGGCEGRQTVFWDWTGTPFVPESSLTSYTVVRTTYEQSTGRRLMSNSWDVNRRPDGLPKRFLSEDRDLHCGQRVEYRARANQAARQSVLSDPISFETERCPSAVNVMLTFDTLQIGPVNDTGEEYFIFAPDRDTDLEIIGNISAADDRPARQSSINGSGLTHSRRVEQGTYAWSSLVTINSFSTWVMNESQPLTFAVNINEIDTDMWGDIIIRNTPWCSANMVLTPHSLEWWGSLNQTFTLTGGNAEGSCTVNVRAVGTPVR